MVEFELDADHGLATFATIAGVNGIVRVEAGLSAWRSDVLEMVDDLRRVLSITDWTTLQDHGDRVDATWRASRAVARGMIAVEVRAEESERDETGHRGPS